MSDRLPFEIHSSRGETSPCPESPRQKTRARHFINAALWHGPLDRAGSILARADVLDLFERRGFAVELRGDDAFLAACARNSRLPARERAQVSSARRAIVSVVIWPVATLITSPGAVPLAAQSRAKMKTPPTSAKKWAPPRTPQGRPDLQGIWANSTITPLERPQGFESKAFFTKAEAAAFERDAPRKFLEKLGEVDVKTNGEIDDLNANSRLTPDLRTSLIVDPADGKIPKRLPDAGRRLEAAILHKKEHPADGPEDLTLAERCLLWPRVPPMLPPPYNDNLQIVQTPGYVMILTEMIHHARIIPLDGRPHLPPALRQWGDSRGRWEGDTLVIDTTNFRAGWTFDRFTPLNALDEAFHVVERLTRVAADTIRYEFTIDDPTVYTRPWTAMLPLRKVGNRIFEFACHEGNYSAAGILRGARAAEQSAEEGRKKQ
jgi:hypothetical protein